MSSNSSSKKAPILEMLLFGGLAILLLSSLLRWNMAAKESGQPLATTTSNPTVSTNNLAVQPNRPAAIPPATPQPVAATTGTHRVLCVNGDAGLNFRPQAGFSAPLFVVPCGSIVTVTGAPVNVQNETWLPVTYANRNGWSASKLLAPIR